MTGIPESVLLAALTTAGSFVGAWAALKVHLRYLRRDIDAAHRRLDAIDAPSAWGSVPHE